MYLLAFLRRARITRIDTFAGSVEHWVRPDLAAPLSRIDAWFDADTAELGARTRKLKGRPFQVLARLVADG